MKKRIIKLTESKLIGIVKDIINEEGFFQYWNQKYADRQKKYAEQERKWKEEDEQKRKEQAAYFANWDQRVKQQKKRIENIALVIKDVDLDGIIRNPASKWNGKRWVEYVSKYNISQTEANEAKTKAMIDARKNKMKAETTNARIKNIANIAKSVDSYNTIINPSSKWNNKSWSDFLKFYKITPEEVKTALETLQPAEIKGDLSNENK